MKKPFDTHKPKTWFETVSMMKERLDKQPPNRWHSEMDTRLMYETNVLLQLFKDCAYLGFVIDDKGNEKLISDCMKTLQEPFSDIEWPIENPFQNVLYGYFFLYHTLQLIKKTYEKNLPSTLQHFEKSIYESNDYQVQAINQQPFTS